MNQPFCVTEDGQVFISEAEADDGCASMRLISGAGIEMPEAWAERAQEKADLLERRLLRIEHALGISGAAGSASGLVADLDQL